MIRNCPNVSLGLHNRNIASYKTLNRIYVVGQ